MALEFYRPGNSLLHRFDPRAKIVCLAALTVCFMLPFPLAVSAVYIAALAALVGLFLGIRELAASLRSILPLLAVIAVLTPLLRRGGDIIWAPFGFAYLTRDGVAETARLLIRFSGIVLSFMAVLRSMDPDTLILTLRWYGLSYRAALVLVITLRFIPTIAQVYANVRDAHALRGGHGRKGFLRSLMPVLTSILINAVKSIPALAMTLESRGFGRANRRTEYAALEGGWKAALHIACAFLCSAALFIPLLFPVYIP